MTEEYPITTHPDGKQFIRIEDKWMPVEAVVDDWQKYRAWCDYSKAQDWSYWSTPILLHPI